MKTRKESIIKSQNEKRWWVKWLVQSLSANWMLHVGLAAASRPRKQPVRYLQHTMWALLFLEASVWYQHQRSLTGQRSPSQKVWTAPESTLTTWLSGEKHLSNMMEKVLHEWRSGAWPVESASHIGRACPHWQKRDPWEWSTSWVGSFLILPPKQHVSGSCYSTTRCLSGLLDMRKRGKNEGKCDYGTSPHILWSNKSNKDLHWCLKRWLGGWWGLYCFKWTQRNGSL